jgi:MFS family permease
MSEVPNYPSTRAGWTLTVLLTVAYIFSYIDRSILGLLVDPIKADLKLTDADIGYVSGIAFAIFYATMGLPLGWLADRTRRTRLVAGGIGLWSLATAACGLAGTFWHLFLARMSVGVGEATLGPAAMSLIGDSFPPEKRGKPVALYSAALGLGAGIAGLASAAIVAWTKGSSVIALPLLGDVRPWQMTFIVVGLPGLLIALAFMFVREPPRQSTGGAPNGLSAALSEVGRHAGAYAGLTAMVCVMTITAYAQGYFTPSAFTRAYGWPTEKFALYNGMAALVLGPATMAFTGWLNDRMASGGIADAPFRLAMIAFVAMVPMATLPFFLGNAWATFGLHALATIPIAMLTASGLMALLAIAPAAVRGQVVALYYVAISLSGLLLGPTTVGKLSTGFFGEAKLGWAIGTTTALYSVVPLFLLPVIWRIYHRKLAIGVS